MAENDMVEKVARAICASDFDGDEKVFDTMSDEMQQNFRINARAAIEALREPTDSMKFVGGTKCENMMFGGDPEYTGIIFNDMGVVFRTMIDAALSH